MQLPITQEHIDEAIRRIAERQKAKQVIDKPVKVIVKSKKKKHIGRKWWKGHSDLNRQMDYAIWNDKD